MKEETNKEPTTQMMAANRGEKMSASCTRDPLMTQGQREGRLDAFTVDFGPRTLKICY